MPTTRTTATPKTAPTRARKAPTAKSLAPKPSPAVGAVSEAPKPSPAVEAVSETILIHFVNAGFSGFGQVWSVGQELEVKVPSPEYDRTCDANGNSWLRLSPEEQNARWGEIKFKLGPSSIPNSILEYPIMPGDTIDSYGRPRFTVYLSKVEREKAAQIERARGRKVPTI